MPGRGNVPPTGGNLKPLITVSASRIRLLMRLHRVTIREISREYQITLKRVRQVRAEGGPSDWPIMIETLSKRGAPFPRPRLPIAQVRQ